MEVMLWGGGGGGLRGRYQGCCYAGTTKIIPVLRLGNDESHFKCFINCEGQSHKQDSVHRTSARIPFGSLFSSNIVEL